MTSFTVFAEELYTLPPTSPPHPPTHSPHHPQHHHHHHHHPPASAPVHSPAPSAKPPTHTPVKTPPPSPTVHHRIARTFVAVQGVVYVKPCKYAGVDTLLGATPLLGAIVKLQCNNTRYKLVQTAKTDKNGYFFLEAPKTITNYGAHKCNVVLVSASTGLKPSNLHGGVTGSTLRIEKPYVSQKGPFTLYTVGPLALEPKCPL
ncbi:hypothetical protein TanjilG_24423 [Lupinus angustifolius]|uniref:Uncharacterized protein n=2 Tax=Lupinus angustifolius TaxID=3871 RepID=A0A1J7GSZ0_LUPAN|nr:hypothetical protein TanjilG_24423 [Lupinus angustifolius]